MITLGSAADLTKAPMRRPDSRSIRPQPRSSVHTVGQASTRSIDTASLRAVCTLVLAARGLIEIINALGHPWAQAIKTLVLAALGLGFFAAAQRSHDHRVGWLLSSAATTGLAIVFFYSSSALAGSTTPGVIGATPRRVSTLAHTAGVREGGMIVIDEILADKASIVASKGASEVPPIVPYLNPDDCMLALRRRQPSTQWIQPEPH
jgi:hypothetical protein